MECFYNAIAREIEREGAFFELQEKILHHFGKTHRIRCIVSQMERKNS